MKKKILLFIFTMLFFFIPTIHTGAQEEPRIRIVIDNKETPMDPGPVLHNDRTMVPLRSIFEQLGFLITWIDESKTVICQKDSLQIVMNVDSNTAYQNGTEITLDAPPMIRDSYTYVPLRFLTNAAHLLIEWDSTDKTIYIQSNPEQLAKQLSDSVVMLQTDAVQGSGVVISEDGLIATNYHVVKDAQTMKILFQDTTIYQDAVSIVSLNPHRDLALIKINKNGLIPASIHPNTSLNEGQAVIAIGSPSGRLNQTTTGVIESVNQNVINSSALLERGSSGGGLFDQNGNLIGISAAVSDTGYNFSIPIHYLLEMPQNPPVPLAQASSTVFPLLPPETVEVGVAGKRAAISWEPILGVDCYYVYRSNTLDGTYEQISNPNTGEMAWYWGYPECFGLTVSSDITTYFKIASVKNGQVSPLSQAVPVVIP